MLETIVGIIGVALIGVVGWAIQLGNRVSVVETEHNGLVTLINARFAEMERRLTRIEDLLTRRP